MRSVNSNKFSQNQTLISSVLWTPNWRALSRFKRFIRLLLSVATKAYELLPRHVYPFKECVQPQPYPPDHPPEQNTHMNRTVITATTDATITITTTTTTATPAFTTYNKKPSLNTRSRCGADIVRSIGFRSATLLTAVVDLSLSMAG